MADLTIPGPDSLTLEIEAPAAPPLTVDTVAVSIPGPQGEPGRDGRDFRFEDFTPEQLEQLRGPKGENGKAVITWELIYSNDDVNKQKYLTAGYYSVRSYAESRTIANLPTQEGTSNKVVGWLQVRNLVTDQVPGLQPWAYTIQEMTGIDGKLYRRIIRTEGNPKQIIYGAWARG